MSSNQEFHGAEIAIVGMSARFPGAPSIDEFWQLLNKGESGLSHFSKEELEAAGVSSEYYDHADYVPVKGRVDSAMDFDAEFFQYNDREAMIMDPQLRLYHEAAWQALEDAGCADESLENRLVGLFGGASANALWTSQFSQVANKGGAEAYEVINLISRDFFNTRLAYKLNLKGPAVTVQTACSTGLVAVHQACQSLLSGDSDVALAGAVSMSTNPILNEPDLQGYMYQEGMILSPDGECRPFDASAKGTVVSDGVGFVVLKRLQDAIDDGDQIHAIIKGTATNNDGQDKVGYTAPSVVGQQQVLDSALQIAGVEAESVSYIEAHGTGTKLGDPIEVQALNAIYGQNRNTPCLLGSVKSNFGHLDTAAGIAGLIKTVLALKHQTIPANLHYKTGNDKCVFSEQGIQVAEHLTPWHSEEARRAAISSFGIGGTNAHVVLEEYCSEVSSTEAAKAPSFIPVSAHSEESLKRNLEALKAWSKAHPSELHQAAYTAAKKRQRFDYRNAVVFDEHGQASLAASSRSKRADSLVFMFSGQGAQYPEMAKALYDNDDAFKKAADECLTVIATQTPLDIKTLLWGEANARADEAQLQQTQITQLALFVVEYAISSSLISKGFKPDALIGHSLGEYVAATLAGVFSLQDAIRLVNARAELMGQVESGKMAAIHQSVEKFDAGRWPALSIAAINTANDYVISGETTHVDTYLNACREENINTTELKTSSAFHSVLMEPVLTRFAETLESVQFNAPTLPIVSNVSGEFVTDEAIQSIEYWTQHLRGTVQFHKGLSTLLETPNRAYIEVGPGKTLASFVARHDGLQDKQFVVQSLRSQREAMSDLAAYHRGLAELFALGFEPQWDEIHSSVNSPVSLPPYQFNGQHYSPDFAGFTEQEAQPVEGFYQQNWESKALSLFTQAPLKDAQVLFFNDGSPAASCALDALKPAVKGLVEVAKGESFSRTGGGQYELNVEVREGYDQLVAELTRLASLPTTVISFWGPSAQVNDISGFMHFINLAQAFTQVSYQDAMTWFGMSRNAFSVTGCEPVSASEALVYGALRVISQENQHITAHQIDLTEAANQPDFVALFSAEGLTMQNALRGQKIWQPDFQRIGAELAQSSAPITLKSGGVYALTGGFGGTGQVLARYLASEYQAKLVLVSRSAKATHPLLNEVDVLGGQAVSLALDLSSDNAANTLLDTAQTEFGELDGIFHLAGLPGETMVMNQSTDIAAKVIDSKLASAQSLVSLTAEQDLDFLVLFSSVTGILGGMGQSDYSAANLGLDAVAEQAHSEGIAQVFSIRWDAWKDAGMAVDALNGKRSVIDFDVHPLLGDHIVQQDNQHVYCQKVQADYDWPLAEHWVMGMPTVPGTTYLEMSTAAYRHAFKQTVVNCEEVYFLAGLALPEGDWADVYTQLTTEGSQTQFEISSYQPSASQYQLHAKGVITSSSAVKPTPLNLEKLQEQCSTTQLDNIHGAADLGAQAMGVELDLAQQDKLMKYGERWNCFDQVWIGHNEGLAKIALPEQLTADVETLHLHPALLDCAVSFLRAFIDGGVYIPISYNKLTQFADLPSVFYSYVRLAKPVDKSAGVMSFDLELCDEQGEVLVAVTDFTMKQIEADLAQSASKSASIPLPEFVYRHQEMPKGISNDEAMSAIEQVLAHRQPVTLLAASDFKLRFDNFNEGDTGLFDLSDAAPTQVRPRPELETDYVAAKTPTQKQLADVWAQMLGLEQVGIQDDFFELGGDSLLLMQIHKKVQKAFGDQIAVVELYNYPTIQRLAEFIDSAQSPQEDISLSDVSARIEKKKAARRRRKK